jgi:hypothetical protein
MHRIWKGMDPKMVVVGTAMFCVVLALTLHMWAFNQFGWPKAVKMKYNPPVAAAPR